MAPLTSLGAVWAKGELMGASGGQHSCLVLPTACPHVPRFLRKFTLCPHGVRHTRYRASPCTGVLASHAFRQNAPQQAFDNLSVDATVLDYKTQSNVLIHPVIQIPFGHRSYKYSHTLLFAISVRRKCYQMLVHAHPCWFWWPYPVRLLWKPDSWTAPLDRY